MIASCNRLAAYVLGGLFLLAGPGAAQEPGSQVEEKTISILFKHKKGKIGTTEIDIQRGVPLFNALIAGREVCALLDTGAEASIVDTGLAREAGLKVSVNDKDILTGIRGAASSYLISAVPIEIPAQFAFERDMIGADLPDYDCPDGKALGFVLGMDFLGEMAVLLDAKRNLMVHMPRGSLMQTGEKWVSIDWRGGFVPGSIEGKPTLLQIDTGSSSELRVRDTHFDDFFPDKEPEPLGSSTTLIGKRERVGLSDIRFSFGPLSLRGRVILTPSSGVSSLATLGYPALSHTSVILDAKKEVIFLLKPSSE